MDLGAATPSIDPSSAAGFRLSRGGGSVTVNADGTISVVGDTDITGDLTVTGGVIHGALIGSEVAGAIEWDGSNFRGYTGSAWIPLDVQATSGGWADDGTVVRLATAADNVHIGAATAPGAKLKVTGNVIVTGTFTGAAGSFTTGAFSSTLAVSGAATLATIIMSGGTKQIGTDTGIAQLDFNFEVGTVGNATRTFRFGRETDTGTGILTSTWYIGNDTNSLAMRLDHKTKELTVRGGLILGTTVTLTEGSANRLDLASGDDLYIVSGRVSLGLAPESAVAFRVGGGVNLTSGASQWGANIDPLFSSAATAKGTALALQLRTEAAAFAMGTARGLHIVGPNKGAGSTITTLVGLDIDSQTQGGSNFAIRTGLGLVQFGDDLIIAGNIGFFGQGATAKPTGVAVSDAAIHAALVTLNLIAA